MSCIYCFINRSPCVQVHAPQVCTHLQWPHPGALTLSYDILIGAPHASKLRYLYWILTICTGCSQRNLQQRWHSVLFNIIWQTHSFMGYRNRVSISSLSSCSSLSSLAYLFTFINIKTRVSGKSWVQWPLARWLTSTICFVFNQSYHFFFKAN